MTSTGCWPHPEPEDLQEDILRHKGVPGYFRRCKTPEDFEVEQSVPISLIFGFHSSEESKL